MSPFDYLNQILQGKKNLIVDEQTETDYIPFLINRGLSYHYDCISYANEMNQRPHLDKAMQNSFLINTIRSRKRPFMKWVKPEKYEDLECVSAYYGISTTKAREALSLLSDEQLQQLRALNNKGGITRTSKGAKNE